MDYLKFELEAAPLQFWPVPRHCGNAVVEVLSMIKMTKESILLALLSHEENRISDLQIFQKHLMPTVVLNLDLMTSQWVQECLQDLKSACVLSYNGCRPPLDTWKLDKDLDEFYYDHQW